MIYTESALLFFFLLAIINYYEQLPFLTTRIYLELWISLHNFTLRMYSKGNISEIVSTLETQRRVTDTLLCSLQADQKCRRSVGPQWMRESETRVVSQNSKHDDICAVANCASLVDTHPVRSLSSRYSKTTELPIKIVQLNIVVNNSYLAWREFTRFSSYIYNSTSSSVMAG